MTVMRQYYWHDPSGATARGDARWLLDELRDEEHWAHQVRTSQDALSKLAAEARADHAAGRTTELDPEKL